MSLTSGPFQVLSSFQRLLLLLLTPCSQLLKTLALLTHAAVLLKGCKVPVQLLHHFQILGPGGLQQGVLEWAVLEELLFTGHWNDATGPHF